MVTNADVEDRNGEIADILVEEFDSPVQVVTADLDQKSGVIYGNLLSSGNFYSYALDDNNVGIIYHDEETQELNQYALGLLSGYGIRTDSESPWEYSFGLLRTDAQVRCTKGGTPCGKVCLPKGSVCRKYGGGGTTPQSKLRSTSGNVSSGIAGAIAGGAAATVGLGAVGTVAYLNRQNLAKGGQAVAGRIRAAGSEGKAELKTGLTVAKNSLKEGFKVRKEVDKSFKKAIKASTSSEADKSKGVIAQRGISGATAGAAIGGAVGSTTAGVENASRAVGRNLKAAGGDIKETGKAVVSTTKEKVKNLKENFTWKKQNPEPQQSENTQPSVKGRRRGWGLKNPKSK